MVHLRCSPALPTQYALRNAVICWWMEGAISNGLRAISGQLKLEKWNIYSIKIDNFLFLRRIYQWKALNPSTVLRAVH